MRAAYHAAVNLLQSLIAALQFLTRLPIPIDLLKARQAADRPEDRRAAAEALFRRSTVFFPVAGIIIGAIVAVLAWGLSPLLPTYVNTVLLLLIWISLSGGLHLDGLMDTADGLLSHRSRERMLDIMKDSRVGAMGVIVCVLYLMLKAALLFALLHEPGRGMPEETERLLLLAIIPVWSRSFMVTAIAGWPYARQGSGMGQLFRRVKRGHSIAAFAIALLITVPLLQFMLGWPAAALWGIGLAAAAYAAGTGLAALAARKLGGLTGDVYGALNEMIELLLLLAIVAIIA